MSNVVKFSGTTRLKLNPSDILLEISKENLDDVVVIGVKGGNLEIYGSMPDIAHALYWMEKAKHDIVYGRYDD